jgi:hypothetical protein
MRHSCGRKSSGSPLLTWFLYNGERSKQQI